MSQETIKGESGAQEDLEARDDVLGCLQPKELRDPYREPTQSLSSKVHVALWAILYPGGLVAFLNLSPLERLWIFLLGLTTLWIFFEALADILPKRSRRIAGIIRIIGHYCGVIGILSYVGLVILNLTLRQ